MQVREKPFHKQFNEAATDQGARKAIRAQVESDALTAFATMAATAPPAGGSSAAFLPLGTTARFGIYFGSGAPTVSAAKGSLYLRSDGSSTSTRMYVNTNDATTWTNVTTAA